MSGGLERDGMAAATAIPGAVAQPYLMTAKFFKSLIGLLK
jgi:hypothetical protein